MSTDHLLDEWWDSCAAHRLCYRHCPTCDLSSFVLRQFCVRCLGNMEWRDAPPHGSLFTFTQVRRSRVTSAGMAAPYTLAYVELFEGGPLMLTSVRHNAELAIGQQLQLVFVTEDDHEVPIYVDERMGITDAGGR